MFLNISIFLVVMNLNTLTAVFNYQISARVTDKVSDFTYLISKTLSIPLDRIKLELVNISNPYVACGYLFFLEKKAFAREVANFYLGMEDGLFLDYSTLSNATYGIAFGINSVNDLGFPIKIYYDVNAVGLPTIQLKNASYNVRKRPWYIQSKSLKKQFWTSPYIDAASGNPVISLVYPIVNYSLHGNFLSYAGSVCADVYLTAISSYLVQSYKDTNQDVFIVDESTLNILGNSFGAMTYAQDPSNPNNKVICH